MIYVVLLNWNGASDTIACLQSLANLEGALPKVIVCDNASRDDSWQRIEAYIQKQSILDIQLVQTGANLGFAGGNNVGLRLALADPAMTFTWLLNNDTEVAPGALDALVRYMHDHPKVAICGSTLLYMDSPNIIQAVGGQYNSWLGTSRHVLHHQHFSQLTCAAVNPVDFDYVVGASMFARRSALETVGLLSEDYFLYFEEIDWAIRLKHLMPGTTLGYAPDSLVYHKEGASTGAANQAKKTYTFFSDYFFITSRLKFSRKFFTLRRLTVQASMLLVAIKRAMHGQFKSALVALCCLCNIDTGFLDPRRSVNQ
jgi:GT2 family glycosyltransferase